jgi:co-chaperonin GroES (HSP10)
MKAVGDNVLIRVSKHVEEKIGSIIVPGISKEQLTGTVTSVGLGVKDERVQPGKIVVAENRQYTIITQDKDTVTIAVKIYDVLAVED